MRRRLGSGLRGELWLGSGRLKRGEGCPGSWRLYLGELSVSDATLADEGRWRYPGGGLPVGLLVGLLVGGLPRPRMKRPALVAEFGGWLGEYGTFENPGPDIMVEAAMLRPPHLGHLLSSLSAKAAAAETELLRMLRRG